MGLLAEESTSVSSSGCRCKFLASVVVPVPGKPAITQDKSNLLQDESSAVFTEYFSWKRATRAPRDRTARCVESARSSRPKASPAACCAPLINTWITGAQSLRTFDSEQSNGAQMLKLSGTPSVQGNFRLGKTEANHNVPPSCCVQLANVDSASASPRLHVGESSQVVAMDSPEQRKKSPCQATRPGKLQRRFRSQSSPVMLQ
mmetsp:Transcript_86456/g.241949  ORF Transcript_86456/g.241949 Transcript_86456/m.241949 type:complete len:203 (+) Transcript_86456:914-1522(+)